MSDLMQSRTEGIGCPEVMQNEGDCGEQVLSAGPPRKKRSKANHGSIPGIKKKRTGAGSSGARDKRSRK